MSTKEEIVRGLGRGGLLREIAERLDEAAARRKELGEKRELTRRVKVRGRLRGYR